MRLSELSAGDLVLADDGFTCLKTGSYTVQADADGRLFIPCNDGKHYLDGQVSFSNPDELIGVTKTARVPHEPHVVQCPKCGHVILSPKAEAQLNYMRREAPRRGGFMYEGARPAYEAGTYRDDELAQLLSAGAIEPHPDPNKGWIVREV